jgi:hypothetical protein
MIKYVIHQNGVIRRQIVCLPEEIEFYISEGLDYVQHDGSIENMIVVDGVVVPA